MTPLRERYIEDLHLKNFSAGTIKVYVNAVAKFAKYFDCSPEQLDQEHIRKYLLAQLRRGRSRQTCVVARNALRHLYTDTLKRPDCFVDLPRPKREHRLPVVLSQEEVRRLFSVVTNLKHRALLMVAYDAGLRVSELCHLKVPDIDSQRMVIRVRRGKGKKDRYARLTPELLGVLRQYWKAYQPETCLFPGVCKHEPYDLATPGRILKAACEKAEITKRVSMHTLRHTFATHLLDAGTNLRVIQQLLGHANIQTTCIYTHVSMQALQDAPRTISLLQHQETNKRSSSKPDQDF